MADRRGRTRSPHGGDRGEKHGWLRFDRYQEIHERALERHPFVVENLTAFHTPTQEDVLTYVLEGAVVCESGIVIDVTKSLQVRRVRGREEVRSLVYRYNAHVRGGHNILRYDNQHDDAPDEYHRHEFDPATGVERSRLTIEREQMPTLIEVVSEVQKLARRAGLLRD